MVDIYFMVRIGDKTFVCAEIEEVTTIQNMYKNATVSIIDSIPDNPTQLVVEDYFKIFDKSMSIADITEMISDKIYRHSNPIEINKFKYLFLKTYYRTKSLNRLKYNKFIYRTYLRTLKEYLNNGNIFQFPEGEMIYENAAV